MPVKLRRSKVIKHRVTPEAIAAFEAGDHLALHRALNLGLWQVSPLDVDDGPSPWPPGTGGADSWPLACELQRELQETARKSGTPEE
ncbi:MAG TPA: hypothetical protein VMY41_11815 [Thermohalobaculum sp.]|nr:hypothetical protein [Thermohalobaculum sp.]